MNNLRIRFGRFAKTVACQGIFCLFFCLSAVAQPAFTAIDEKGDSVSGVLFKKEPTTGEPDTWQVTPTKDDNPLNGVSTFDLVLITKHILGIEYFPTLWQRIAANATFTNDEQVTTLDIVAIRKVILGQEQYFAPPNETSWKFYPETYTLSTPMETYEVPDFDEAITVTVSAMGNSPSDLDFKAVKIGDVNSTHIANACRPEARPAEEQANAGEYPVGLPLSAAAKSGGYITIPLVNEGKDKLEGLQTAFRFDPSALEFVGASLGEVEGISAGCFGLKEVEQGIIRMVWLSPDMDEMTWKPGQVLCNFTFLAKRKTFEDDALLAFDNSVLAAQAYTGDRIYDLALAQRASAVQRNQSAEPAFIVQCRPNPTLGDATLQIEMPEATPKMKIAVFSAFGQRLFFRQTDLPKGRSDIALSEAAQWAPGVYTWRVWNKSARQEGKLIKQ